MSDVATRPVLKATIRRACTSTCRFCTHGHTYWHVMYIWYSADGDCQRLAGTDGFLDWYDAIEWAVRTVEGINRDR